MTEGATACAGGRVVWSSTVDSIGVVRWAKSVGESKCSGIGEASRARHGEWGSGIRSREHALSVKVLRALGPLGDQEAAHAVAPDAPQHCKSMPSTLYPKQKAVLRKAANLNR